MTAKEAARILKVRPQTLYAYVSHGWIRSIPQAGRKERLYLREDIDKMAARAQARRGHGAVAASAMNLGPPIIPTMVTEITPAGPSYRGYLATQLARSGTSFETTAELLWSGVLLDTPVRWPAQAAPAEVRQLADLSGQRRRPEQILDLLAMVSIALGMAEPDPGDPAAPDRVLAAARRLIALLAGCFGYFAPPYRLVPMRRGGEIVDVLLRASGVGPKDPAPRVLQGMLVLLADHELSPSTFSARIAASGKASLHASIAAALCSSSAVRVVHSYGRIEALLAPPLTLPVLLQRVQLEQRRGRVVAGFGHPFYPAGDPRGKLMLEFAEELPPSRGSDAVRGLVERMRRDYELHPRQEFATVMLADALGMPRGSSCALFMLARTAGLVAHIIEQRLSQSLLRPRAKYVGLRRHEIVPDHDPFL